MDTARILAFITQAAPVRRMLSHIGETAHRPARGPPAWGGPPVDLVPDWEVLPQPSPESVVDQEVQW